MCTTLLRWGLPICPVLLGWGPPVCTALLRWGLRIPPAVRAYGPACLRPHAEMLAALVHPHPPKPLLFGCPQAALGLGAGEVEGAVVQAIGKRIIEARIDQLRAVVAITKCAPRTFGADHWKELQQTLAGWREAAEMAQTALTEAATGAARPAPGGLAGGPASAPVRA